MRSEPVRAPIQLGAMLLLLIAALGVSGSAAGAAARTNQAQRPLYYLALGDSLSRGVEYSGETNQGYADQLFAYYQQQLPGLQLVNLGCSGETLDSMIAGGVCSYDQGSQLAQAETFLQDHAGSVALVTIDIGANDIIPCVSGSGIDQTCVQNGVAAATNDLPAILSGLQAAAGGNPPLFGMNYYDPFLGDWLTGADGQALARASEMLAEQANSLLAGIYANAQVPVADVQAAFQTGDLTDQASLNGQTVPIDVARICQWTWMCVPPAPQTPSVHPTSEGYGVIAGAFEAAIGTLQAPP
jgi:lysophospholipase L1-like esterase